MRNKTKKAMLNPKTFVCKRCGECCIKYTVKLSKKDIEGIKYLGYEEKDFAEIDRYIKKFVLKKKDNGWCVFLGKDKAGIFICKIYDKRPIICKKYPFLQKKVDRCKPITFS